MLVVVEYRNIADFFESALYFKASGGGDVLQVDAAEAARNQSDGVDYRINIIGTNTERNGVHVAEFFKEGAFALHDRHAGFRSDVAESEHSRAVGNDRHKIGAAGEIVAFTDVFLYFEAGLGDARRVSQRQILACLDRTACDNLDFSHPFIMLL